MAQHYSSPPDPLAFREAVWDIVRSIPPGRVATYGQIANLVTIPGGISPQDYRAFAPRWVGGAMAACPPDVPWQRVINSQGKISLSGMAGARQRELLESEGIIFDERERIDLKRFAWVGPD